MTIGSHLVTGARSAVEASVEGVRGVSVLVRRGLFDLRRPDHALHAYRCAEKWGPLAGTVAHRAWLSPDAVAIVDDDGPVTHRELDESSNALARALVEGGLGETSVVAVLARDHRGLVVPMLAAAKIGARLVLLNTGTAGPQLAEVVDREGVAMLIHDVDFATVVEAVPASVPRMLTHPGPVVTHSTRPLTPPTTPGGLVLLSSGTTGTPKGAPRERVSILQSAAFLDRVPLPSGRPMVMAAPIFHGTGLSQFILGLALGCTVVLRRRFDAEATVAAVAEHRAASLILVPTMLQRILDLDPDVLARHDTSSLSVILSAGSALPIDLSRRAAVAFGPVLHNLYGSTEVAVALVATPDELRRAPGTVGRPPVGCQVSVLDDAGLPITEPGVVGRVFARSALSFSGYTDGRHKEIADGKLSTGDVGHVDDEGLFFIDGRDDDMIVSGGENVYPLEVENLLTEHPHILEAAVVGVDDPDYGSRLRAHVVVAPGHTLDADAVRAHVKDNLARYKVPRDVVFVSELPRNATGKVLRRNLTDPTSTDTAHP
ncbi:AMP-binding protein [Williamsia maris]|uniref:Fatty-acyl-CoA synthase n=1 Tax=Williamsia maris TaxID=72806 RepID=A0ABT1H9X6_9NOCA|nr:AMP-binding protein [Williamsia maris]MCP2175063.1 fatty-acyl-CoA synthase [Williamsia maris]